MNWWIDGVGIDKNKNETATHTTSSATASSYDCFKRWPCLHRVRLGLLFCMVLHQSEKTRQPVGSRVALDAKLRNLRKLPVFVVRCRLKGFVLCSFDSFVLKLLLAHPSASEGWTTCHPEVWWYISNKRTISTMFRNDRPSTHIAPRFRDNRPFLHIAPMFRGDRLSLHNAPMIRDDRLS